MTAMNTAAARRAALTAVLLSAVAAVNVEAKSDYKPKFTWWAILIMMIGIVIVISVALVIYFCFFYKGNANEKAVDNSSDAQSEGDAAVPPTNNDAEAHEPAHKQKDYPTE